MPIDTPAPESASTRRGMILGVGLVGVAGTLTACGGSKDSSGDTGNSGSSSGALGKASDIPVGGGKIFKDQKVVVTQPTQGQFKAFSAICTHRGCPVGSISGGKIQCPCHGSEFNVADGSVARGPADRPLEPKNVTVQNGEIKLA